MTEYKKNNSYRFVIEFYNNQYILTYFLHWTGPSSAYISRDTQKSDYLMALDFVTTYPQYEIDFVLHGFPIPNSPQADQYIASDYYNLQSIYDIGNQDDFTVYGHSMPSVINGVPIGSLLSQKVVADGFYNGTTRRHTMYEYTNYFILILYDNYDGDFYYYKYKKRLIPTTCCIDLCCYPNDYILI